MLPFRRAAGLVVPILTAIGLFAFSTPASAGDVEHGAVPTAMVATIAAAPQFATLAAAIAAQDTLPGDEPLQCLASAVYFESQGEPLAGQLAVAQVIINRSRSGRFASDICGVIKQRGQFGFVRAGAIPAVPDRPAYRTAIAVAKVALAEAWDAPAPQALYFNGVREHHAGARHVATIGHHAFYR